MFKNNVGAADRIIRAVLGVVLIAVFFMYPDMAWKWVALIVGLILLFTAVISSCVIYSILGIRTNKES
jgi:ABC-type polysaccharide/polyol phosphate export permease